MLQSQNKFKFDKNFARKYLMGFLKDLPPQTLSEEEIDGLIEEAKEKTRNLKALKSKIAEKKSRKQEKDNKK